MKTYSVLIIDDCPIISEAYKNSFSRVSSNNKEIEFNIKIAKNSDSAIEKIKYHSKKKDLDFALIDISIPPSKDHKILSGEDLAFMIRQLIPNIKIIISTNFDDNFLIYNILENIDPDGFLIKHDLRYEDLVSAINSVIEDPPFYSKSVLKLMRKRISHRHCLDKIDRLLLYELSNGAKMKDLPKLLPLSIGGIEKRKRRLKNIFDIKKRNDRELIHIAKEKGFI
ncbi:MAG: response regulator [Bacteroidota bacterium]